MGLLSDSLTVKQSLGQSCRVVQGPSLDPDGWKRKDKNWFNPSGADNGKYGMGWRRRAYGTKDDNSLANEISLDEVREEIEMHGSQGRTIEEVREDIARAYDEEDAMDEAIAKEELADEYEAYAMLTEDVEAEKRGEPPPSPKSGAAALLQHAAPGQYAHDELSYVDAEKERICEEYLQDPRDAAAALIQNAAAGDYGDDSRDLAAALMQNAADGEYGDEAQRDAAAALLQNAAGEHYIDDPREAAAALIQNAAAGVYGEDAQDDAMAAASLIQNAATGH